MKLKELKDKKILILGLGREGESTFNFLRKKFPKKVLALADILEFDQISKTLREKIKKDKKVKVFLGKDYLKEIQNYEILIKSPGICLRKILPYLKKNQKITSQTEIFFQECKGKIVGVTGTKGKSTTATLIAKILKKSPFLKKRVFLVGNIEKPCLDFLNFAKKDSIFVFELSSHQLLNLKKSPQISVFLNIFPEHLDYYSDFQEYFKAKQNIALWQKPQDYFIYNFDSKKIRDFAQKIKSKKLAFSLRKKIKRGAFVENEEIFVKLGRKKEKILKTKEILLKGDFNLYNVMAAVLVAQIFKIPKKEVIKVLKNFKGLAHRLEYIGKFGGIEFYNDSLATIPEATLGALNFLNKKVFTLLAGGFDRGVSFQKLAKKILDSKIKTLILFPESGLRLAQEIILASKLTPQKRPSIFFVNEMKEAVKLAFKSTPKGKACLLSPASPSFGLFKNYKQRGNLFKKYVKKFAKEL